MGKPLPIRIAGIVFPSRGHAVIECSRILNDDDVGTTITGAASEFVEELWLNRPDKLAEFAGKRVVRFERRYRNGKEKWTRCFWAVFEGEDEATDFSYVKALDNIVAAQHSPAP